MKKTLTAPEHYLSYSTLLKRGRARVHIAGDVLGDGVETEGADLLKVQSTFEKAPGPHLLIFPPQCGQPQDGRQHIG